MILSTLDLDALHYKKNSKSQYSLAHNLLKDLTISSGASILDIGCGHGHIIAELSKIALYGRSVGIDPSPSMISLATETFPYSEFNNLEFYQCKAEEMEFPAESFDLIICTNAFMWIRDPNKALKLISKFLKPGGQFILFSYSKETPYVQLFEHVLEQSLPELKGASAVNTMLSTEQHSELLIQNRMALDTFQVDDVIFNYENELEFKNYVLGWLSCYIPLNQHQRDVFLAKLIEESEKFRTDKNFSALAIPHKTISIKASKLFANQ